MGIHLDDLRRSRLKRKAIFPHHDRIPADLIWLVLSNHKSGDHFDTEKVSKPHKHLIKDFSLQSKSTKIFLEVGKISNAKEEEKL